MDIDTVQSQRDDETEQAELNRQAEKFGMETSKDKSLLDIMAQDTSRTTEEVRDKMVALESTADANTKAIGGKITAAFDGAKMTAQTAKQSIEESKMELNSARGELVEQMEGVQTELNHKANETESAISTFKALAGSERERLEQNVGYLRALDR